MPSMTQQKDPLCEITIEGSPVYDRHTEVLMNLLKDLPYTFYLRKSFLWSFGLGLTLSISLQRIALRFLLETITL